MTPAEFNTFLRARGEHLKEDISVQQVNTYVLAALIRHMVWSKHPMPLEKAFPDAIPPPKEMSDEEMYRQVQALNKLLGGKEA